MQIQQEKMDVSIIGLGLIGGSMAIDLKLRGFARHIIGVDNNQEHLNMAMEQGIIDETAPIEIAVDLGQLIILATPLDAMQHQLKTILDSMPGTDKVVIDVGSAKAELATSVARHHARGHYVATHPMAGTEHAGPQAALSGLFDNQCAIICDKDQSHPWALSVVEAVYKTLNMPIVHMDSVAHDISAAYVSHLSHIASFALSVCVQEKEKNQHHLFSLAGGGFRSTVRLAASPSSMWLPIMEQNKQHILDGLQAFINHLEHFKLALIREDKNALHHLITQANNIQDVLSEKQPKRIFPDEPV